MDQQIVLPSVRMLFNLSMKQYPSEILEVISSYDVEPKINQFAKDTASAT